MRVSQKFYYMPEDARYTTSVKEKLKINRDIIEYPCSMYLDQATKTGICIYDNRYRLVTTLRLVKKSNTPLVKFRDDLRGKLQELITDYKVDRIFCEDVFGGISFDVSAKLISIRDLVVDIAYVNGIKAFPLNNMKWKSRLSHPVTWKEGMDDKEQIKMYVSKYYPLIRFEDDVWDAVGMAIAVLFKTSKDIRPLEIQLNKKLKIADQIMIVGQDKSEDISKIIQESKFRKKEKVLETRLFDYDTTLDIGTNFRYVLTNFDVIAVTKIPYHRYYGQILLEYDIRPSEIADTDVLIGLAVRRY